MDDFEWVGILVFGVFAIIYLVVVAAAISFGILLILIFGIIVNMTIRWIANQFDWYTLDEKNIWWLIIALLITPFFGAAVSLGAAISFGAAIGFSGIGPILWILVFPIWLAGYLIACFKSDLTISNFKINFEIGLADAIMASTLCEFEARLAMRWQLIRYHHQMLIESFRSLP